MSTPFCPHCGYNFEADEPVHIDGWRVTPLTASFKGRDFRLSRQENQFLHTLAAARGEWVGREAILGRITDDEENDNLLSVVFCHVRYKLGQLMPVETSRGRGMRWKTAINTNSSHTQHLT